MKVIKDVVVKTQEVVEDPDEGFMALIGQQVILFGVNYHYGGKLIGVNSTCVLLEDAGIIYETGDFSAKTWKDFQKIGNPGNRMYVQRCAIESFAQGK